MASRWISVAFTLYEEPHQYDIPDKHRQVGVEGCPGPYPNGRKTRATNGDHSRPQVGIQQDAVRPQSS